MLIRPKINSFVIVSLSFGRPFLAISTKGSKARKDTAALWIERLKGPTKVNAVFIIGQLEPQVKSTNSKTSPFLRLFKPESLLF